MHFLFFYNLQKRGATVCALQQERRLPENGWNLYALKRKRKRNLTGRGLHRALQSGRSNVTHNNPRNNQLQIKNNNNNSTNNNPRHTCSTKGQIQQTKQTPTQHQNVIPKYKWLISNTKRTNLHIWSSKFKHYALASTQQNPAKNSTKREGPEYSSDIDLTWRFSSSTHQIHYKDSKSQTHDAPGWMEGRRIARSGRGKWRTTRLDKQTLMELPTRNITEHLHQGEVLREIFPYPLLSGSTYKGTVYMFMMNMIWVVNN